MFLDWLRRLLCPTSDIPKPKVSKWILFNGLMLRLKTLFPDAKIYLADTRYGLISRTEYKRFLSKDLVDVRKYERSRHDCDDFSFELMGHASDWCSDLAFGILWVHYEKDGRTMGHALNVLMDTNLSLWCVEPQTDKVFKKPDDWRGELIVM